MFAAGEPREALRNSAPLLGRLAILGRVLGTLLALAGAGDAMPYRPWMGPEISLPKADRATCSTCYL